MKSFGKWFSEQKPAPTSEPDLPDGVSEYGGVYFADCCMCSESTLIECDLADYDPNMMYCGGSPRCCP